MLGLGSFCNNTSLFQAVMKQKISDIIDFNHLTLTTILTGFNMDQLCNIFECSNNLYNRVNKIDLRIKILI